jgi:ABC-type transport system involved in cytochrome c biogenesis permease subunit
LFCTMLVYWVGAAFPSLSVTAALGTAGMAIANLCMATLLGARWIEAGYFPLSNLYESLFFLTWGITAVHLIAENSSRSRCHCTCSHGNCCFCYFNPTIKYADFRAFSPGFKI